MFVGSWFLVVGCLLLVVGCWLLAVGCVLFRFYVAAGCWLLWYMCFCVLSRFYVVAGCWLLAEMAADCWLGSCRSALFIMRQRGVLNRLQNGRCGSLLVWVTFLDSRWLLAVG